MLLTRKIMTAMNKRLCIRIPPSLSRERHSDFVGDDPDISTPFLLEVFSDVEDTLTNAASQSTASITMYKR